MKGLEILGGVSKGVKLVVPSGVRPSSAKVRGVFFNIVSDLIDGAIFLDLFAGSGAVGIEALSRGASKVYFVEKSFSVCKILQKNLLKTGFEKERYKIIRGDVLKVLNYLNEKFDIIYADPPYDFKKYQILIKKTKKVLKKGGILVIEIFHKTPIKLELCDSFSFLNERRIGDARLLFFKG